MDMRQVARIVIRVAGPALVLLGALFWTGRALWLLPLHMALGALFVAALLVLSGLAARAGGRLPLAAAGATVGLLILALGMTQTRLLPGPMHWVVKVTHLLLGFAGMGLAAAIDRAIRPTAQVDHTLERTGR
jgi:hypothetical protein